MDEDIEGGIPDRTISKGKDGFNVLQLKEMTPKRLRLLAQFIKDIEVSGLTIKGNVQSDGSWKISPELIEEWESKIKLDETHWQERTNALKQLGFTSPEAAFSALQQIKQIIDSHNLYLNSVDSRTRARMAKNQCQWAMYQICSTPSNLVELMVGVDVSTAPIKDGETGAVAKSPYNGDDKETAPGNQNTIFRSFQEGQVGKQCVGIGAVSIKVNSTMQFYMDTLLRNGSEEDKLRILFPVTYSNGSRVPENKARQYRELLKTDPKRARSMGMQEGYIIDGKHKLGMSNLYDKNAETSGYIEFELEDGTKKQIKTSQKNIEIIRLLDSIQTEEDITPNVATSLAAMLSVAVDEY